MLIDVRNPTTQRGKIKGLKKLKMVPLIGSSTLLQIEALRCNKHNAQICTHALQAIIDSL